MSKLRPQYFDIPKNSTLESLQSHGNSFAELQRGVLWWIGDLARYAESRWPDKWQQVFPEWVSPGLIDRCKGVARAYPNEEDRNPLCTYTQHLQACRRPDRKEFLEEVARKGLTSDESRTAARTDGQPAARWLLAVDANYWLNLWWHSGNGVESGHGVAGWLQRTVSRLKDKGLTDVVMCFDSPRNFRKELTADWEKPYKDRPPKEPEFLHQLQICRDLLEKDGFLCVSVDGFEADDLLVSYAAQFDGKVTLFVVDKDLRQALTDNVNMLTGVRWEDDEFGEKTIRYEWLTAKQHTDETGIPPGKWADWQAIAGDSVDSIQGAAGIGKVGATQLIQEFGRLDAVIEAARNEDERIKPKKRESILELDENVEIVRQLVTLRRNVEVPTNTRV